MKSNYTFTLKNKFDKAKRLYNEEILVAIGHSISSTNPPSIQTTMSNCVGNDLTLWMQIPVVTLSQSLFDPLVFLNILLLKF